MSLTWIMGNELESASITFGTIAFGGSIVQLLLFK